MQFKPRGFFIFIFPNIEAGECYFEYEKRLKSTTLEVTYAI